jgi:hypothetical protein
MGQLSFADTGKTSCPSIRDGTQRVFDFTLLLNRAYRRQWRSAYPKRLARTRPSAKDEQSRRIATKCGSLRLISSRWRS